MTFISRFNAILIPVPDISIGKGGTLRNLASGLLQTVAVLTVGLLGALVLTEITQLEHDKGNVLTAHRVDGGYALTQRGGNKDDRVFLRMFLRGKNRYVTKNYLDYLADQKSVPIALITRETIFVKSQIESVKTIVTNERRQTLVLHVILRQLRSAEGLSSFLGSVASTLFASAVTWFGDDDIYADDVSAQSGGAAGVITWVSSSIGGLFN